MSARWGLVGAGLLAASTASAQERGPLDCDGGWNWLNRRARVCEMRELTAPATDSLTVDAGPNGSILVTGDERRDVHVRARVEVWGADEAEAERIAKEVTIRVGDTIEADGPEQRERSGWSVSYELLVPRVMDLTLETTNGGLSVVDVRGKIALEAVNGGINLENVGGNVRAGTTNGGVNATLAGAAWEGDGLELTATNGGVHLRVPRDYSARLEAKTVNGGVDIDFPVTVQGRIGREVSTTLGNGGALLRLATTNGGVRVSRR